MSEGVCGLDGIPGFAQWNDHYSVCLGGLLGSVGVRGAIIIMLVYSTNFGIRGTVN